MKPSLFFILLLIISFSCLSDEDVVHLVHGGNSVYEELTKLSMQNTLVNSAKEYEKYGHVARATNHDMAYPKDSDEYSKMNGFGILWVTSHSQLKEELPIKNLRISIENIGTIDLEPIYSFPTDEQDELVAKVLGKHRSDAIYMIPFFEEVRGATLIADYSANRTNFIIGKLEKNFPPEIGKLIKLPTVINYPDMDMFNVMLEREYPIAKELITKSEIPNKLLKAARFNRWTPQSGVP
jgi:hypothetical protein